MIKWFRLTTPIATAAGWITQLSCIYALWLLASGAASLWWLAASFTVYHLLQLSCTVGCHRLFTHRTFECHPAWHWLFAIVCNLSLHATTISWVQIHTQHHKHSDTDLDPHTSSWRFFFWREYRVVGGMSAKSVTALLKSPVHRLMHDYNLLFCGGLCVVLYLVHPMALLFGYMVPVGAYFFVTAVNYVFGHYDGHPRDIPWLELILPMGEWGQGTHHDRPREWDFGRWDVGSHIIRMIKR